MQHMMKIIIGLAFAIILLLTVLSPREAQPSTCEDSTRPSCPWKFQKYTMSPYTKLWVDHAEEWGYSPCERYKHDNNEKNAEYWYDYTKRNMDKPQSPPDTAVFDTLTYERTCTGEIKKIYIEPLALLMRNPRLCGLYGGPHYQIGEIVDKNYLLVDWEIKQQREDTHGKVYLFDMGASTYNTGLGGTSQAWFVEQIEKRGLTLDGIYAWEYTVHDAKKVFAEIPQRLWPIYHWYNIPISDKIGSLDNPWDMIARVVKKEDMVIVKLDVDTPPLEVSLIKQLIANDTVAGLIDVLYYEDHTETKEMAPVFGNSAFVSKLKDSMHYFVELRKKGIRAHPWV